MKNTLYYLLIGCVILSLSGAPVVANAMPEPAPATQTDKEKAAAQKAKEKEKAAKAKAKEKEKAAKAKAKEKEKEQAAKAKEKEQAAKEKAKAAAAKEKEREAASKEREKAAQEKAKAMEAKQREAERKQAERDRKAAEAEEREQKAIRDYEKYQESLENPKTEAISYINLGLRLGYAAMMDKINGSYMGAGTLNQSNALQQLKGGAGAGLNLTYNLEYGHFLFETGLDLRFLNSTSAYGFQAQQTETATGATYTYLFDNLSETRNMFEVGLPLMFGAQFSRYYFLVGAKVHYGLPMGYSQKGKYDVTVEDPNLLEPYGLGIYDLSEQKVPTDAPIKFRQPDLSIAAEVGIDLDEWLQKQPDPKAKKAKVKAGERLPFGRQHVHYRVGLFAEYGVLNTNATPKANPVDFAGETLVQKTNTMLAMNGDTKLNNLFVGAKFTIQFEIPGKKERPVPPPPSYAVFNIADEKTGESLLQAFVETTDSQTGKVVMRRKQPKTTRQRHLKGSYIANVNMDGYKPLSYPFTIDEYGVTDSLAISLTPTPVFRVRVTNKETGMPVPANIRIIRRGETEPAYLMATDSTSGAARQALEEGQYRLLIAQMGYDSLEMAIASVGDSLNLQLTPVKKGEVFIIKNLHFATNKTRILKTSEEALNDLYMYLARNPQVRIKIIGHTDSVGKDEANRKLSEGRANAVLQDLVERGIATDRIEAEGRGETQPIDTNDTEEGRQNNRRVEIEIL